VRVAVRNAGKSLTHDGIMKIKGIIASALAELAKKRASIEGRFRYQVSDLAQERRRLDSEAKRAFTNKSAHDPAA